MGRKRKRLRKRTVVKRVDKNFAIKLEKVTKQLNKKIPEVTITGSDITSVIVLDPRKIENRLRNDRVLIR